MRYSLDAGGKRLRPILTLAAAETVAGNAAAAERAIDLALPAACAVELIHTYSLIHDDLPAMDDDSLRRGRPTNHVVYGEGMAILAGDGLLTEAFALLSTEPRDPDLAGEKDSRDSDDCRRGGPGGMVGGQAIDLLAVGSSTFDEYSLQDMHARKTGALIRAAAVAGAIMGGGSDEADCRRRANTAGISDSPFRSSTTFSMSRETPRISARRREKTPSRASRPTLPPTASTSRAASRPNATTLPWPRCDRWGCSNRGWPTSPTGSSRGRIEIGRLEDW